MKNKNKKKMENKRKIKCTFDYKMAVGREQRSIIVCDLVNRLQRVVLFEPLLLHARPKLCKKGSQPSCAAVRVQRESDTAENIWMVNREKQREEWREAGRKSVCSAGRKENFSIYTAEKE